MRLLLEKFANYWQLRFITIGICICLVVYAVMMPVHSSELVNPVGTAGTANVGSSTAPKVFSAASSRLSGPTSPLEPAVWFEKNRAAAARLDQTARLFESVELPRDAVDLIRSLRRAADDGDRTAQFLLGEAYQTGLGVTKDMGENARWYTRAAAQPAMPDRDIGSPSIRVPHSYGEAFQLTQEAAASGDAMAELYLGLAYDRGDGVPRDLAKAAVWYRKAAAQGSVSAACNLGELYLSGEGVAKDAFQAGRLLTRASDRGSVAAQFSLGEMYSGRPGAAANDSAAAMWLEKAASKGNVAAQVMLSSMYANGTGVAGSSSRAYMWINLAAAQDPQLSEVRDGLESELTTEQIVEGQRLTHQWLIYRSPG